MVVRTTVEHRYIDDEKKNKSRRHCASLRLGWWSIAHADWDVPQSSSTAAARR